MAVPIWKDINYTASTPSKNFVVKLGGENIYERELEDTTGFYLNKVCDKHMNTNLPDFREITDSAITNADACKEVVLQTKVMGMYTTLSSFTLINDWSYEEVPTGSRAMSEPINGRADCRMKLFYTTYKDTTGETISWTKEGEITPSVVISPLSYSLDSDSGTTNINVTANTNFSATSNSDWITVSPTTGNSGTTALTVTISGNTTYSARTGTITIYNKTFTVSQSGKTYISNKIYYTTTDGNTILPASVGVSIFGANLEDNTYSGGIGTLIFDSAVTMVGVNAFKNKNKLQTITLPESVTSIGNNAFKGCTSLEGIEIPSSVTSIDYEAFNSCISLSSVTIPNSITNLGYSAFYACSALTEVTIPTSISSISGWTFGFCSSLTSITIPDNITFIGNNAFENCSSLTEVNISSGVNTIGNLAFTNCTSLSKISCSATTAPTIYNNTFQGVKTGGTLYYPTGSDYSSWLSGSSFYLGYYNWNNTGVPNNQIWYTSSGGTAITPYTSGTAVFGANIVSNTYSGGKGVITFDGNVTTIGESAFADCRSLSNITIPNSVTSIGLGTFSNCYSLSNITIPNSVISIGAGAFNVCTNLSSITIPNSVTSIGDEAFGYCTALSSITFTGTKTQWANITLGDNWNYDIPATVVHCTDGDVSI